MGTISNLILILQHFGALDSLVPTQLGRIAAAIRGENELWLGLVFASGELDNLHLYHSARAAGLVVETPRPDSKVNFELSNEVAEALEIAGNSSPNVPTTTAV